MTDQITEDAAPAPVGAWATFSEHVTIAGAEDLQRAEWLPIRVLFVLGLVLASLFGVVASIGLVKQYWNETNPVEIKFKDDGLIPFPNVTICTTAVNNVTAARKLLVIPPEVEEKLTALRVDKEAFLNDAVKFTSLSDLPRNFNHSYLKYIDAVFTATAQSINGGGTSMFDITRRTLPSCEMTLSNCVYNGIPFNCCREVVLGANDGLACYGVPVSRANNDTVIARKPNTFNVQVKMDWRHVPFIRGADAFDGFIVIIGQPYTTMNNAPVAVAPGWHGVIKLAGIKSRKTYTDCIPSSRLPSLSYFPYYDLDGKHCELEVCLDTLHDLFQCTPMAANYVPNTSEGCTFSQGYAVLVSSSGEAESDPSSGMFEDTAQQAETRQRSRLHSLKKRCKPVCQRWQYEPIVGYSELRSERGAYVENGNISWSRITVIIPSAYYEEHVEGSRASLYVLMCNIGGTLGVCVGLSAVTVVQTVAYGCYAGARKKGTRVQEESKEGRDRH